jgi:hypothetical protein
LNVQGAKSETETGNRKQWEMMNGPERTNQEESKALPSNTEDGALKIVSEFTSGPPVRVDRMGHPAF